MAGERLTGLLVLVSVIGVSGSMTGGSATGGLGLHVLLAEGTHFGGWGVHELVGVGTHCGGSTTGGSTVGVFRVVPVTGLV